VETKYLIATKSVLRIPASSWLQLFTAASYTLWHGLKSKHPFTVLTFRFKEIFKDETRTENSATTIR
jgi:hypothetical protein